MKVPPDHEFDTSGKCIHCPATRPPIAQYLAHNDLTDDDLRPIQALGFRAQQVNCKEVLQAVATVLSALQGCYNPSADETE